MKKKTTVVFVVALLTSGLASGKKQAQVGGGNVYAVVERNGSESTVSYYGMSPETIKKMLDDQKLKHRFIDEKEYKAIQQKQEKANPR